MFAHVQSIVFIWRWYRSFHTPRWVLWHLFSFFFSIKTFCLTTITMHNNNIKFYYDEPTVAYFGKIFTVWKREISREKNQIQQYAVVWCEYAAVIQCDACAPGFWVFECTSEEVWVSISDTIQTHFSGRIMKPTRASPTICCLFRPCFQLALCLYAVLLLRRSRLTAFVPILYLSHSL